MTPEQITHMVGRFLGWRLPKNFSPDAGISFKAEYNENTAHPMRHEPMGTNLLDAVQAEEMVRYITKDLPVATSVGASLEKHQENAELRQQLGNARAALNGVYTERNQVVALAARMAKRMGYAVGLRRAGDASPGFTKVVYFDLPTGQVSWHVPDHELEMFEGLGDYPKEWDGHSTFEKYGRVRDAFTRNDLRTEEQKRNLLMRASLLIVPSLGSWTCDEAGVSQMAVDVMVAQQLARRTGTCNGAPVWELTDEGRALQSKNRF